MSIVKKALVAYPVIGLGLALWDLHEQSTRLLAAKATSPEGTTFGAPRFNWSFVLGWPIAPFIGGEL